MGKVLRFPRHARAPSGWAASDANASKVTPPAPRSAASATMAAQWAAGMPRRSGDCQPLTVESDCPSAPATAPVPPRATMIDFQSSIPDNIVRNMRTCQGFATCETTIRAEYGAIGGMGTDHKDAALRLIAVRKSLGFENQDEFAVKLDLTKSTYNPFERGKRPLSMLAARRIRERFGVSVDYLLFGDIGQPKEALAQELGPRPGADPVKVPKRRRKART